MEKETEGFDDPALKAAIQKCFGRECAPRILRERVSALVGIQPEQAPEPAPLRLSPPAQSARPLRIWPTVLSLAAIFLVGIDIWAFQNWISSDTKLHALLVELIAVHDASAGQLPQDMVALPPVEYAAQARQVASKIPGETLVATIHDDGWEFRTSKVQTIHDQPAAQFIFHREGGQAHISVFTLPASAWRGASNTDIYSTSIDGHCVAAFAHKGQVYAMVGFCPRQNLQVSTVFRLLADHRTQTIPSLVALMNAQGSSPSLR